MSTGQVHHGQRRVGLWGDAVGDVCAVQGAALQPPDGRAGHREHRGVLPQPGQAGEEPNLPSLSHSNPAGCSQGASLLPSPHLQQSLLLLSFSPVSCFSSPFPGLTASVFLSESHWKNLLALSCLFPVLNHFTLPCLQLFQAVSHNPLAPFLCKHSPTSIASER